MGHPAEGLCVGPSALGFCGARNPALRAGLVCVGPSALGCGAGEGGWGGLGCGVGFGGWSPLMRDALEWGTQNGFVGGLFAKEESGDAGEFSEGVGGGSSGD